MGERHALLIGTDKFEDPELTTLLAPVADVEALSAVLLDPGIGGFNTAPVLLNPGIVELQKALHALFDDRGKDDMALLYYTGHGLMKYSRLYLALYETRRDKPSIGSLEAVFVRDRMRESPAQTQIIVLDCCHSGAFMAGAKGAEGQFAEVAGAFNTGGNGQYIMSACSSVEQAYEDRRAAPHSIFTQHLVAGLRSGDAAPDQDMITIDALYTYTHKQVIDAKWPMVPQRDFAGGGSPLIARNPYVRKDVPKELRDMLLTGDEYQRLGAVQQLREIIARNGGSYTARRAIELLREGLKSPRWVSVQEAIRAVPGLEEDARPPVYENPEKKPDVQVPGEIKQGRPKIDRWASVAGGTLFVGLIAASFLKPYWDQWWTAGPGIVVDGRTIPASGSFRELLADKTLGPEMVVVQAGSFIRGSPKTEDGHQSDEEPTRTVTIAKPFAAGKFEVTFDEWRVCANDGGCQSKREPKDSDFGKGRRPVIDVSWNDAQEYVTWLSKTTGKPYRLLSEAEWEYAARADTTTAYSTGKTITATQAQFEGSGKTAEVGSFPANNFGLHDMHGNVREWVQDCYVDSYKEAPTDGSTIKDSEGCNRVNRGGGWFSNPQNLRSALRNRNQSEYRNDLLGFRLARTL